MAFATVEQISSKYRTLNSFQKRMMRENLQRLATAREPWEYPPISGHNIRYTPALATRALEGIKNRWLEHRLSKGHRPWELVDLTTQLDPQQNWYGVEFETGFTSFDDYQRVINELWQNHDNCVVDAEGHNEYAAEITFSPINEDVFRSEHYHMDRLLAFTSRGNLIPDFEDEDGWNPCGIHVNFSTPALRALPYEQLAVVAGIISRGMEAEMTDEQFMELFNRKPYGFFYPRQSGSSKWIEGKLFESTNSPDTWNKYREVMLKCPAIFERVLDHFRDQLPAMARSELPYEEPGPAIANMYELFTNDPADVELVIKMISHEQLDDLREEESW